MHLKVRGDVREFAGPDGMLMRIRPYDPTVMEAGKDVYHLTATPFLVGRDLYVSIDDAMDLLALYPGSSAAHEDGAEFSSHQVADAARIERRSAARAATAAAEALPPPNASRFSLRYVALDQGPRTHQVEFQGDGQTFHGAIGAYGESSFADATYGLVTIGSNGRDVAVGSVGDPLAGAVFSGQPVVGVRVDNRRAGATLFDVDRIESGREIGVSMQRGNSTRILAVDPSNLLDSIAGIRRVRAGAGGIVSQEIWFSPTGFALGFSRTTAGRAFVDASSAIVVGRMPLTQGDAPNRIGIGYRFSPALTVRSGYGTAMDTAPSAYINATLASATAAFSVTRSRDKAGATLYARGRDDYASVAFDYGRNQREWQMDSGWNSRYGDLELTGYSTASSDLTAKFAVPGRIAPVVGYEISRSSTQAARGVLLGVAVAAGRSLDVEVDSHPNYAGRALRVGVTQRFTIAARPLKANHQVELRGPAGAIGTVLIDGRSAGIVAAGSTIRVNVASPEEQIAVRTADGRYESVAQAAGSDSTPTIATLLPLVAVTGTIVLDDPQHLLGALPLDGLEVELGPGLATAITSAGGAFAFPAAPVGTSTHVVLSPETLPPGVETAPALVDANGTVVLHVRPKATAQRTIF